MVFGSGFLVLFYEFLDFWIEEGGEFPGLGSIICPSVNKCKT